MNKNVARLFVAGAIAFSLGCQSPGNDGGGEASISADGLVKHIKALSDDKLAGRAPATEGSEMGMKYIAEQYQEYGLKPAAKDGSWFQYFDIIGLTAETPKAMTMRSGGKELTLNDYDDYIAFSGVQEDVAQVENVEIVFVGYGVQAPEYDWDDYKNADLKGKVFLMLNNDPQGAGDDPEFFAGNARLYYGRWDYKYEKAAEMGAAGAIIIHTTPSAGYPFQVVQSSWTGEQFELPYEGGPKMPFKAWTTFEATQKITDLAGKNLDELLKAAETRDFQPVPLGVEFSFSMNNRVRKLKTANVLGLLEGHDEKMSEEIVIFTAHHDHLGAREDAADDGIYNGALDNASGVATMLEIAKAFANMPEPPSRSLLFAAVAAEESGLLGSKYFARHPSHHPGKIAANINIDGANIWGETNDVEVIGHGKSDLDDVVQELAEKQGRRVVPDQSPDKGYYYRSDQFSLAKIGVPAVYLGTGVDFKGREEGWGKKVQDEWTQIHYHQPSDEYNDSWDLSGAVQDARLYFQISLRAANSAVMPGWRPGDEFEAIRKKMLQEASQ